MEDCASMPHPISFTYTLYRVSHLRDLKTSRFTVVSGELSGRGSRFTRFGEGDSPSKLTVS